MWRRCAYLLEGVRLDDEIRLHPMTVGPIALEHGYFGRDGRDIFNAALARAGFVTVIAPWTWGPQIAPRRRLALAVADILEVDDAASAVTLTNSIATRVADALALTHGGAPHVVAGVAEISEDAGVHWRMLAVMVGSGPWPGSALDKLATDAHPVSPLDVAALWQSFDASPRTGLWLSLHRGIAAEPRWDVRMFRVSSLLELIARELICPGSPGA